MSEEPKESDSKEQEPSNEEKAELLGKAMGGYTLEIPPGLYNVVMKLKVPAETNNQEIVERDAIVAQVAVFLLGTVAVQNLTPFQSITIWHSIQQFFTAQSGVPNFRMVDLEGKQVFPPSNTIEVVRGRRLIDPKTGKPL